jgi:tape measure domain-containing protein
MASNVRIVFSTDTKSIEDAIVDINNLSEAEKQAALAGMKMEDSIRKSAKASAEAALAEKKLENETNKLTQAQRQLDQQVKKTTQETTAMAKAMQSLGGYIAGAFTIQAAINFGKAIVDTTLKLESLNKRLSILGDSGEQFEYLSRLANKYGLDLMSTADAYSSFAIAATSSGLSLKASQDIFENVSTAVTAMQLPAESASRVFYALQQMMSKGTVSAEELRQQLGEALPGSFAIAAQSMGMTEKAFNKMLETGQIVSKEFVPQFAQALAGKYEGALAGATDTATAATNRLSTAWTNFMASLSNSNAIKEVANFLTMEIRAFTALSHEYLTNIEKVYMGIPGLIMAFGDASKKMKADFDKERDAMAKDEMKRSDATVSKRLADERIKVEQEKGRSLKQINQKAINNEKAYTDAMAQEQNNLLSAKSKTEANNASLAIKRYQTAIAIEKNIVDATTEANIKITDATKKRLAEEAKAKEEAYWKEVQMIIDIAEYRQRFAQLTRDIVGMEAKTGIETEQEKVDELIKIGNQYGEELKAQSDARIKVNKEESDADKAIEQEKYQYKVAIAAESLNFLTTLAANAMKKEEEDLQKQYEMKLISEEQYQIRMREIKHRQAVLQKANAIAQILLNTAIGISAAISTVGGTALVPFIAALGALQLATALATPLAYAEGTLEVPDRFGKPGRDSVPALLMPGEAVTPTKQAKKYRPLLAQIHADNISEDQMQMILNGTSGGSQLVQSTLDTDRIVRAIKDKPTIVMEDRAFENAYVQVEKGIRQRSNKRFPIFK